MLFRDYLRIHCDIIIIRFIHSLVVMLDQGVELTVRRDKDRLLVQMTGQPFLEVYPETETDFFYKVVDAQLTFIKNEAGEVTHLTLYQSGFALDAAKGK